MSSAHGKSIFNCDGILVGWANTILTNTTDSVKTERNDKGNVDCMLFYWHTLIFICLKVEIHLTINTCKWLFRKINDYYFVTIPTVYVWCLGFGKCVICGLCETPDRKQMARLKWVIWDVNRGTQFYKGVGRVWETEAGHSVGAREGGGREQ